MRVKKSSPTLRTGPARRWRMTHAAQSTITVSDVDRTDVDRLATRAADGDGAALAGFIRATQSDVATVCRRLADPDCAEDLVQETYLRAMRALPGFRGESTARTWLLGIATRVCADEVRARTRRRRRAERYAASRPIETRPVPDVAGHIALEAVLADLDHDRRTAFVLTQLIGLSYAEAAQACDCAVGTIRSRVARARDELVAAVEPTHSRTARR